MTGSDPLVSVIIPVFNGERYLAEAIESVLQQTCLPKEIIVVDDGSEDHTAEIAQSYPQVQYLFQVNQGAAAARNAGIDAACGDLITFLDGDDIMLPNAISKRVAHILQNPNISCLISMHQSFLEPGMEKPSWLRDEELSEGQFGLGHIIAKKSLFVKVGGFDPKYLTNENLEILFRAKGLDFQIDTFPEVVILRRIHTKNLSQKVALSRANMLKIARASIERQKAIRKKS